MPFNKVHCLDNKNKTTEPTVMFLINQVANKMGEN